MCRHKLWNTRSKILLCSVSIEVLVEVFNAHAAFTYFAKPLVFLFFSFFLRFVLLCMLLFLLLLLLLLLFLLLLLMLLLFFFLFIYFQTSIIYPYLTAVFPRLLSAYYYFFLKIQATYTQL